MEMSTTSPVPEKINGEKSKFVSFFEAIESLPRGKRITKKEWGNQEYFGELNDNAQLVLHKPDGNFYQWILSEGDIIGKDWLVLD